MAGQINLHTKSSCAFGAGDGVAGDGVAGDEKLSAFDFLASLRFSAVMVLSFL